MPETKLLDWNRPLLPAVTDGLLDAVRDAILDLGDTIVIVPTIQSGRRLRESLSLAAADRNRGLLPPEILTPDQLLARPLRHRPAADEATVLAAWFTVLSKIDLARYPAVFPVEPQTSAGWRLGLAQRFARLQGELGEEGLAFADVAERDAETGFESERWHQLASLEKAFLRDLENRGLEDPRAARRAVATDYRPPEHVRRIILAATPDPQPLPLQALAGAESHAVVEVWIYGEDRAHFDNWGRPLPEIWTERPLDLEGWGCHFHNLSGPEDASAEFAGLLGEAEPESVLLGLADPALNPIVAERLAKASIATYDPDGEALALGGPARLAELLGELVEEAGTTAVRSLLQHPDIAAWLDLDSSPQALLRRLDRVFQDHLCADLDAFLRVTGDPGLRAALKRLEALRRDLADARNFGRALAAALRSIYAGKQIDPNRRVWIERAKALRRCLDETAAVAERFPELDAAAGRSLFRQALNRAKVYPDRPREAHDLLGWLELLWNDAPHAILAGINEGLVPESVVGDAFLPESLRETLGLRTNARRFARDAYLLEAACRRRATNGRIDILVPQAAADGTPLKPSRLLFQSGEANFLPRVRALFAEPAPEANATPHTHPWRLRPPPGLPCPAHLSVSQLKGYLECPFRFFLRHILRMRPLDVESRELTPAAFGSLFHDSAAQLAGLQLDPSLKPAQLAEQLATAADALIRRRYGAKLSFALRLQREALMARIEAFAERQVEDVAANGRSEILDTEKDFSIEIEGIEIRGRIDRIDRRDGRLELIDYKTADQPAEPARAHLAAVARKAPPAHLPEEAFFEHEGKRYRWVDLQLPLYVLATRESGAERPGVAYVNLPKTLDRSGFARWSDFTESHLESARACAAALVRQIKSGIFWPPNETPKYDDFAPLFPDGLETTVDSDYFTAYPFLEITG